MGAPRLLLDENVTWELVAPLRERGYDVVHVRDLGLLGADDQAVFAAAVREGRSVMTQDVADFVAIVRRASERGDHHPGLLVTRLRSFRALLGGTLRVLHTRTADDLRDATIWIA